MAYRLCAFADEADSALCGQIEALSRNGISLLELRGVDGRNVADLMPDAVRDIRRRLDGAGIAVWSIGSPTGKIKLTDDFVPHREQFKRMLDSAVTLGASRFRLFSFYEAEGEAHEVIDRLGALCELAEGSGVILCHENEKGIFGDSAAHCRTLLEALPSLRAVFDPANFVQCGEDPAAAWAMLRDRVDYLHIKDSRRDGTVVPAGYGDGGIPAIVADYLGRGGEVMTLEPHLADFCGLAALEQERDKSVVGSESFRYADNHEAFDAAVTALRQILSAGEGR